MKKELIYTDERKLALQKSYNEGWANAVNTSIEELKKLCGTLTDEQIRTFLAAPSSLADELTEKAKAEYDAYVATIPQSVRVSLAFNDGGKSDAIKAIHKCLMSKKPYQIMDKTFIEEGVCLVDEASLKNECSVFGDDKAAKVYELSVKAAKLLNELDKEIHLNPAGAESVECWGRWQGFVNITDDKSEKYKANPHLLYLLEKE